jgi:acetyltransferase-like isoleucine patch superfamily enzyme
MNPFLNGLADEQTVSKSIVIKNGAWIGGSSIILKGVIIGSKSIVGAGSVVAKNVPPGEIWAGNPAKFIKKAF